VFYLILKGKKPSRITLPEDYPDNEIKQSVEYINRFIDAYNATTDMAYTIARGEINFDPPKGNLLIQQSLKGLQASLKNLTWTTQQIARGDFDQKVTFMKRCQRQVQRIPQSVSGHQAVVEININNVRGLRDSIESHQRVRTNHVSFDLTRGLLHAHPFFRHP